MNKKIVFVALGAYYLGHLNLPRVGTYAYKMYVEEDFPYPRTLAGVAMVITPFTYPVSFVVQKLGYLETAVDGLEEFNKKLKFKRKPDDNDN
jgi:hypothetical protein